LLGSRRAKPGFAREPTFTVQPHEGRRKPALNTPLAEEN
jgi:hypothetical protein